MKNLIAILLAALICPLHTYAASVENQTISKYNATDVVISENYLSDFSSYSYAENFIVSENNPYYTSIDGVLFSKDKKTLVAYPRGRFDETYYVPDGTEYIAAGAFFNNRFLRQLTFPDSLSKISANPFAGCKFLKKLHISENNRNFAFDDGALYNFEKDILYFCIENIPEFTIPESVRTISYGAFSNCDTLKKIILPQNLTKIESMAFCGCSALTEINLPKEIDKINPSCFIGCSSLKSINADNSYYFKSDNGILYSNDMIDLVVCPQGKSGTISIPNGVKNILNGAFDGCSKITSVIFPESTEYVARAFSDCTALKTIELPPTQAILEYGTFFGCNSLEWVYLPNNIVIIQDFALPDNTLIACDEGSFSEYYAEENSLKFQYKFNISFDGKKLSLKHLPFEKRGTIYLAVNDLCEALDGITSSDTSVFGISLNCYVVTFKGKFAEITKNNQTDIVPVNLIEENGTVYMALSDLEKLFNLKSERIGSSVNICKQ